ncbi:hypothetical protein JBE04_17605 [Streptomyces sp. PRKS01-29]|nr:hypothetical protein [Streptomyces sabulosicollis]MBI0296230.1 hypothetical protein [Streptomyces sabulosicollis]
MSPFSSLGLFLLARYHPTTEITAPPSRFAGLYDTSHRARLPGLSPRPAAG